ncbi:MAG: AraC family transcriptional regulator [Burkholderiaceae bacterium]|nr:AraC family transcriptional regulator [Burkholderiaceae bacterium]MCD8516709.1 AraC family transcriptional regulator [Burkholderiaceae bacterium]
MSIHLSTYEIVESQRLEFWNEVVCKHCVPAASHTNGQENFKGRFTAKSIADIEVCEMSSLEHTWDRGSSHLRAGAAEDFLLAFMLSGNGHLEQSGRVASTQTGGIVLYDSARPFKFRLEPESVILLKIPRDQLLFRVPQAENFTAIPFAYEKPLTGLLASTIKQAAKESLPELVPSTVRAQLAGSLLDLLGATLQMQMGVCESLDFGQKALLQQVKSYIEEHLTDPGLDTRQLAEAHCISTRTLTRLFAQGGITPMRWVWQRRLQSAYFALKEGRAHQVTEAAFRSGFNDVAHFSRLFKRAYGMAPSALLSGRST